MNQTSNTPINAEQVLQSRQRSNLVFRTLVFIFCLMGLLPLFMIFSFIFKQGITQINWEFISSPAMGEGDSRGIYHSIVGTFIIISVATLMSVPFSIGVGTYLAENKKTTLAKWTRLSIDILQGIPSIVIGILCWALLVKTAQSFSALSASVALGIMMIPLVAKSTEETIRLLPSNLKHGSLALGAPYWKSMIYVVLPAGSSGIVNGVLLAVARITGETAPLLFTALGSNFTQYSLFGEMSALPLTVYNYARDPDPAIQQQAWGAALVLLSMVLISNLSAKILIRKWKWRR
jgi:phosphate transport system permease protein